MKVYMEKNPKIKQVSYTKPKITKKTIKLFNQFITLYAGKT